MKKISLILISFFSILYSAQNNATVLTFDINNAADGSIISQSYGDNVTAVTMGNFGYGAAGGFTPNVSVSTAGVAGNTLNYWSSGYNDLFQVIENEPDDAEGYSLTFTADAGYNVVLTSLDIGNWGGAINLPGIRVFDESNTTLFQQTDTPLAANNIQNHVHIDFSTITGQTLTIEINTIGLGGSSDNVGLDNIQFGQVSAVPVPGAVWLFGSAIFGLLRIKRLAKL